MSVDQNWVLQSVCTLEIPEYLTMTSVLLLQKPSKKDALPHMVRHAHRNQLWRLQLFLINLRGARNVILRIFSF